MPFLSLASTSTATAEMHNFHDNSRRINKPRQNKTDVDKARM